MTASEPKQNSTPAGAVQFANTHWTVVLQAANANHPTEAKQALEELCGAYWFPLYAFIRRQGHNPHDAQDLTQGFFERLLEKDYLNRVDRTKGKFRSFLLASLKHFLANEWDKAKAQKRGGGQIHIPIDGEATETHCGFEPSESISADKIYEQRWAIALLERVMARLRQEYVKAGKLDLFDKLKVTLTEGRGAIAYVTLGEGLKMSEGAVKVTVHRLRQRYRELLRAEIAQTVATPEEVEDELRSLFAALAT